MNTRTRLAAVAVAVTAAGLAASLTGTATASSPLHPTGVRLHPDLHIAPPATASAGVYPDSVDLSAWNPPVGNQGQVGSCVTWAEDYGVAGWWAKKTGRTQTAFAPMYVYSQIQNDRGWSDSGAYSNDGYDYAAGTEGSRGGIDTKADYLPQGDFDWQDLPTAAQVANAQANKLNPTQWVFSGAGQGTVADDAIKNQLSQGRPVSIAFPVYSAWDNLNSSNYVLDANNVDTSTLRGNHEVWVYGYNSTGLLVQNSWGTWWGNGGRAVVAWNFVEQYVSDSTYTTGFQSPEPPPVNHVTVQQDSNLVSYTGTWGNLSDYRYNGGTTKKTVTYNSKAYFSFTGKQVKWITTKGPKQGKAEVWYDGVKKATVSLYSSTAKFQAVGWTSALATSAGAHRIQVRDITSKRVDVDAFVYQP